MQGQKGGGSLSHLPRRRRHNSQLRHEFNECLLRPVVERDANFPFIFLPRGNGFLTESEARLNSKLIPGRRSLPYPLSLGRDRVSRFFLRDRGSLSLFRFAKSYVQRIACFRLRESCFMQNSPNTIHIASQVSVMSKLVPSPDWFVGLDGLNLCENGKFVDSVTVEVQIDFYTHVCHD